LKAIERTEYGSPDILQLNEVIKPIPKENEVLIKVHATSINASDWEILTGKPLYTRIYGLFRPKIKILGSDVVGCVEAIGKNVLQFTIGDEVFGDILGYFGGFAEYVCAPETLLKLKPVKLTVEDVAALPQSACIALQGIRDNGQIQAGQKVLINGAGGGAGTFAIQIAKLIGAEVTGVDNTKKLDIMRSVGADHVIDYTHDDFTQKDKSYDLILDLAGYHSIFDYKRALSSNGKYFMVGGSMALIFQLLTLGQWFSMTGSKKFSVMALKANKDLSFIIELIETGKIKPIIDKCYPLSQVPEALRYFGEGNVNGKIVITM